MLSKRWPKRTNRGPAARRPVRLALGFALIGLVAVGLLSGSHVLRDMVTDYAASAARDDVVTKVNAIVQDVMASTQAEGMTLVDLQRDGQGGVTAVTANAVVINDLAAEVLSRAIRETEQDEVTVDIPLANLFGSVLLMNHGPSITVHVTVLSSSSASFHSELTDAGINQTRHQLFLDLDIQLSFVLPWRALDTSVQTEILLSETVIVGDVPNSYMNWER